MQVAMEVFKLPITVPDNLPAKEILHKENIFIMDESRAFHQDIRPLKIGFLNLMPIKSETEVQIIRLLANTPLQIELTLVAPVTHEPKNTSIEHLVSFYTRFKDIKRLKFDGFIITGAPLELLEFTEVDYWEELSEILEWTKTNVTSSFHICWGAQAALYYHYGIPKYPLKEKLFGVYAHKIEDGFSKILRGFDDTFYVPHSRHTETRKEDILKSTKLKILSQSEEAGLYMIESVDKKQIFVTGHSEYDPFTLKNEYERDLKKGAPINAPQNYFDAHNNPIVKWRSHANLLFSNWINYYVYQETPYIFE